MIFRQLGWLLVAFAAAAPPAHGKRLTPRTTVCVAQLELQPAQRELFRGKLHLILDKNSGWEAWDAEFADVVARELIPINSERADEESELDFTIAPVSNSKRDWQEIMVGAGICTTEGPKICQGGTFRFPMQQTANSAAKIVMRELFTSNNLIPPCQEEWFDMD